MQHRRLKRLRLGIGSLRWRILEATKRLGYRYSPSYRADFWQKQAQMIHERWGNANHDYKALDDIFRTCQPRSVLDVGCGSGRLFELFLSHRLEDIVGIDISERALELARERFPNVMVMKSDLQSLQFPHNRFDLAVCNRILQHIPLSNIHEVLGRLCEISRMIYINELTSEENLEENFYMNRYDYPVLLGLHGFNIQKSGRIGSQRYYLFGHGLLGTAALNHDGVSN